MAPPSLIEEVLAQFPGDDLEGRLFFHDNAVFYFNAIKSDSERKLTIYIARFHIYPKNLKVSRPYLGFFFPKMKSYIYYLTTGTQQEWEVQ